MQNNMCYGELDFLTMLNCKALISGYKMAGRAARAVAKEKGVKCEVAKTTNINIYCDYLNLIPFLKKQSKSKDYLSMKESLIQFTDEIYKFLIENTVNEAKNLVEVNYEKSKQLLDEIF